MSQTRVALPETSRSAGAQKSFSDSPTALSHDSHEMTLHRRRYKKRKHPVVFGLLRLLCVLLVMLAVVAPVPVSQASSVAVRELIVSVLNTVYNFSTAAQDPSAAQVPVRTQISRMKVLMGETRSIALAIPLTSIVVVSPEIAAAVLTAGGLTLTGLHVGETMLIGFDGSRRSTFMVEVIGRTYLNTHQNIAPPESAAIGLDAFSGSYALSYTAPLAGGPTLLRQSFDFQKKLSKDRTLRFSSDMFKFMGSGNQNDIRATAFGLGLNRMSLGIDGPDGSIDVLDSNVNVSPLSFSGSVVRGIHIISSPGSRLRGIELFAGQARPSLSLFDMNQGRVLGVIVPIAQGALWHVRAGMFYVWPGEDNKLGSGGPVLHLDGRYTPSNNLAAEGEVAYGNGGLSWRGRLDIQTRNLSGSGEILRFDRRSPLISIGAQGGGREAELVAVQWRVSARLNASFSYNHTAIVPPETAGRVSLDRTTLWANASYRFNQSSQLGLRFVQQQIETEASTGGARFRLETRTLSVTHDLRLTKSLTNNVSARFTSSREPLADAGTESGVVVNEQLRYSFKRGSATGFVNYARQQQSLAGLIVRNPRLLPPVLQAAFAADPARFLEQNRNSLSLLLPGVELPQTRGLETGLRLQAAFSRVSLASEVRYSASEILAREQRNIIASTSMNLRLDAANALQVTGSRSFGANGAGGQSALTVSFVHRFGAGSGGGLQFSRLLGLERGHIQGRVFFDINGNGQDEANEPGVAGMKVQMGGDRGATTDAGGRFRFETNSGGYQISLVSEDLGVRWRASTMTEQHGFLAPRQTVSISFGVTDYGSVGGRVFNDVSQKGEQTAGSLPGVEGVRLSLRPLNAAGPSASINADGSGAYQFRSILPGSYMLEIDSTTLPADFRVPPQTSWLVVVSPLQNLYLDIALFAQRAISGVVFVDTDGDGKFDLVKDRPVEGASVSASNMEVTTGRGGLYILRNLPAGKIEVRARTPSGTESGITTIELVPGPIRRKGVNLIVSTAVHKKSIGDEIETSPR